MFWLTALFIGETNTGEVGGLLSLVDNDNSKTSSVIAAFVTVAASNFVIKPSFFAWKE